MRLQLPVYSDRKVETASFDKSSRTWTVQYSTSKLGSLQSIKARHVVFAIGIVGRWPIRPKFEGEQQFPGPIIHSSEYVNAAAFKGKKVAVVGSSTTACDIASDCVQEGVDVTMVQRGPTRIYPAAHIEALQTRFWTEENGADLGDIITSEDPIALQWPLQDAALTELKNAHEPEYYEGLRRVGFLFENEGPLHQQIYCASVSGKRRRGTSADNLDHRAVTIQMYASHVVQNVMNLLTCRYRSARPSSLDGVKSRSSLVQRSNASTLAASNLRTAVGLMQTQSFLRLGELGEMNASAADETLHQLREGLQATDGGHHRSRRDRQGGACVGTERESRNG